MSNDQSDYKINSAYKFSIKGIIVFLQFFVFHSGYLFAQIENHTMFGSDDINFSYAKKEVCRCLTNIDSFGTSNRSSINGKQFANTQSISQLIEWGQFLKINGDYYFGDGIYAEKSISEVLKLAKENKLNVSAELIHEIPSNFLDIVKSCHQSEQFQKSINQILINAKLITAWDLAVLTEAALAAYLVIFGTSGAIIKPDEQQMKLDQFHYGTDPKSFKGRTLKIFIHSVIRSDCFGAWNDMAQKSIIQ